MSSEIKRAINLIIEDSTLAPEAKLVTESNIKSCASEKTESFSCEQSEKLINKNWFNSLVVAATVALSIFVLEQYQERNRFEIAAQIEDLRYVRENIYRDSCSSTSLIGW